ncbi:TVP38/TMEM64 family protein [Paenibacillus sp. MBLB4367]|uniref:TVP38/TMEM64 family protein n=1 Tax=Paenibacillus sp. MBLB4367 TaxID=3384767 RepID=UPI003907FEBE
MQGFEKKGIVPTSMLSRMIKYAAMLLYAGMVILAVLYRDELRVWIQEGARPPVFVMLAVATLVAMLPVPVIPYGVVSGLMAAKYGLPVGIALSWAGSTLAALLMLLLVRGMGADKGRLLLAKYKGIDRFTSFIERHPFVSIMLSRMIPVLPAQAINIYAAVIRIPFWSFALASGIGKLPLMALYAIAGFELLGSTA